MLSSNAADADVDDDHDGGEINTSLSSNQWLLLFN